MVQTNSFQVRTPLLQFCPTSDAYLPDYPVLLTTSSVMAKAITSTREVRERKT